MQGGTKAIDHRLICLTLQGYPRLWERYGPRPQRPNRQFQQTLIDEYRSQGCSGPLLSELWGIVSAELERHSNPVSWQDLETILQDANRTLEAHLERSSQPHKSWIRPETWDLMLVRRPLVTERLACEAAAREWLALHGWQGPLAKAHAVLPPDMWEPLAEIIYREKEAHKLVHRALKGDRKWYFQGLADEVQAFMDKGDLRQAYGLVRRFTKQGVSRPNIPCKPDGALPHTDGEVLEIWQDYREADGATHS